MAVPYRQIEPSDLKDPNLEALNDLLQKITEQVNTLAGEHGTIPISGDIDMQGRRIINLGAAQSATDALAQSAADGLYGPAVMQKVMDITGTKMLATARRLNDKNQQEQYSTFLNAVASTPPGTNTSTVTVVAAGANSTITVSAGYAKLADNTQLPYAQRIDTVANPGAGSYFFMYYLRVSDLTLQVDGPYTSNTSFNQMNTNLDGRVPIAVAQVNAGGGGSGGGGMGGTPAGCTEVGTELEYFSGATPTESVEPCHKWVCMRLADGTEVKMATDTFVSTFKRAQTLVPGDLVEKKAGKMSPVTHVWVENRPSYKMVVREPVHGTYLANGARLHNAKVLT